MDDTASSSIDPARSDWPRVYIVVLNWNGWSDTIECLESLFRISYPEFRVVVCDNGSTDASLETVKCWADGLLCPVIRKENPLRSLSIPPVPKPIPYIEYDRQLAELGGRFDMPEPPLILVQTGANLGFAGGNNVGLRYALARNRFNYIWLLNNDTVVAANALTELVATMRDCPDAGMCGSTILFYDAPNIIQRLGGATYYKWVGLSRGIGRSRRYEDIAHFQDVAQRLSFIAGSSILVRKRFLQEIGLMNEEYFLYYEELDWAVRSKNRYAMAYSRGSVVYHREGGTIGTKADPRLRSLQAEYYLKKNLILFTRKYFPRCLPTVGIVLLLTAVNRALIGRWDVTRMIFRILLTGR